MLKIRLMRIGAKQRPFYRVVVIDERSKRNGAYIELLGTYNPLTEPKEIKLKQDRIDHWIKMGAQMSDGFLRMIGKAPQRKPRKPKKSKQGTPQQGSGQAVNSGQVAAEQPKQEKAEEPVEEKPVETPAEKPTQKDVIASEAKQSSSVENPTQIASEPSAPRNDDEEKEQTDERPA